MVLLGLLGVAVGATISDPASGDTPSAKAMGIGAALWWIVSGVLALLAGGWATGRLAGLRRRWEAPLHGLVTWAITTTAMLFLMSSAVGSVVSGAFRVVDTGSRLLDRGPVSERAGRMMDHMERRHRGDDQRGDRRDRDEAAASAAADRDADEAPATISAADEAQARQAAQAATDAMAAAAWATFAFLLLTAAAAAAGALGGAPHHRGTRATPVGTVRTAPTLPGT